MKYIKQFLIILLISFMGEVLRFVIPFPVPASIYGLIIMLAALKTGIVPLSAVEGAGNFLIEIMPMMFIPASVGLIVSWAELKSVWLPVLVITLAVTVIVMAVTGTVTQLIIRRGRKKK